MKKILFTVAVCIAFAPFAAHAASISFDMPKTAIVGGETQIDVKIHTVRDKVNAVSGSIVVDPNVAQIVRTSEGGSAIVLWIERPTIDPTKPGSIEFSGITPGGFQGDFTLFSFIAKPLRAGALSVQAKDVIALKNNGQGTSVAVTSSPASLAVGTGASTSTIALDDSVPPESFVPVVSSSNDLFDGHPFVSFAAQDKGTGIDHYEYAYGYFFAPDPSLWKTAQSPLEIDPGSYAKRVFIKAIDKAGNATIASAPGPRYWVMLSVWGILILILALCALIYIRRRYSSFRR